MDEKTQEEATPSESFEATLVFTVQGGFRVYIRDVRALPGSTSIILMTFISEVYPLASTQALTTGTPMVSRRKLVETVLPVALGTRLNEKTVEAVDFVLSHLLLVTHLTVWFDAGRELVKGDHPWQSLALYLHTDGP